VSAFQSKARTGGRDIPRTICVPFRPQAGELALWLVSGDFSIESALWWRTSTVDYNSQCFCHRSSFFDGTYHVCCRHHQNASSTRIILLCLEARRGIHVSEARKPRCKLHSLLRMTLRSLLTGSGPALASMKLDLKGLKMLVAVW
jgi:hypothetical protein